MSMHTPQLEEMTTKIAEIFLDPPQSIREHNCAIHRQIHVMFVDVPQQYQLHSLIRSLNINEANAHRVYATITNAVFQEEINWGRIITVLHFNYAFAGKLAELHLPYFNKIPKWFTQSLMKSGRNWLISQHGWEGILPRRERTQSSWSILYMPFAIPLIVYYLFH